MLVGILFRRGPLPKKQELLKFVLIDDLRILVAHRCQRIRQPIAQRARPVKPGFLPVRGANCLIERIIIQPVRMVALKYRISIPLSTAMLSEALMRLAETPLAVDPAVLTRLGS